MVPWAKTMPMPVPKQQHRILPPPLLLLLLLRPPLLRPPLLQLLLLQLLLLLLLLLQPLLLQPPARKMRYAAFSSLLDLGLMCIGRPSCQKGTGCKEEG